MPQFDFLKSISFFIKYRNTSIIARALIPAETMSNILPEKEEKLNINFISLPGYQAAKQPGSGFYNIVYGGEGEMYFFINI